MRFVFLILSLISLNAAACEEDLLFLLAEARQTVLQNFQKDDPCYRAALIGRTQGLPGCFPPGAFRLQNLLKPIFQRATSVCQHSCRNDGKAQGCRRFVNQEELKKNGIDLIMRHLKTSGLPVDALLWDQNEIPNLREDSPEVL